MLRRCQARNRRPVLIQISAYGAENCEPDMKIQLRRARVIARQGKTKPRLARRHANP